MSIESDALWPLRGGPWRMGGYVSAGFDVFQGDEAHDGDDTSVDPRLPVHDTPLGRPVPERIFSRST